MAAGNHWILSESRRTWSFNVSGNGRNFVVVERDPAMPPATVNVILNWNEELKRLVPVD